MQDPRVLHGRLETYETLHPEMGHGINLKVEDIQANTYLKCKTASVGF
jgi:hypothetical protein